MSAASGLARWQLVRAQALLGADPGGRLSIAEVAAACQLSRGHFSKAFRASTGLPPHRWLMAQRIERARQLLLHSPLSISEIADDCGFSDQSHLTRAFSDALGLAPRQWQRKHRECPMDA
ncbi:MAG: AraC family transcriptional regulator [Pseudomonadota bacterium]